MYSNRLICFYVQNNLSIFQTLSRTSKKARPQTVAAFREHEYPSESEHESDAETHARTVLSDVADISADFNDQDWDTDLEQECKNNVFTGISRESVPQLTRAGTVILGVQICFVSVEEEATFDGSLRSVYLESCRKNKIIPANYFLRHMLEPDLAMRHHGLGPDGIKPLSVALVVRLATVIFPAAPTTHPLVKATTVIFRAAPTPPPVKATVISRTSLHGAINCLMCKSGRGRLHERWELAREIAVLSFTGAL